MLIIIKLFKFWKKRTIQKYFNFISYQYHRFFIAVFYSRPSLVGIVLILIRSKATDQTPRQISAPKRSMKEYFFCYFQQISGKNCNGVFFSAKKMCTL